MALSVFAQYHIRKLLHRDRDNLKLVAAPGRNLAAHAKANLDEVVEGLYLEERAIEQAFQKLNTYAQLHSTANQYGNAASLSRSLESKMFRLLGLELRASRSEVTVQGLPALSSR